jgi:hypothetical protein
MEYLLRRRCFGTASWISLNLTVWREWFAESPSLVVVVLINRTSDEEWESQ